jgi:hypothetical protein
VHERVDQILTWEDPLKKRLLIFAAGSLLWAAQSAAQVRIDLKTQAKRPDFGQSGATRPAQTGGVLPVTCSVGEQFFLTAAPAGRNLYACSSTDTCTPFGRAIAGDGLASIGTTLFVDPTVGRKTQGMGVPTGAANPCAVGDTYVNTTPSPKVLFDCVAPNTWQGRSSGTVTSVGLSLPGTFAIAGAPVTGAGVLEATYVSQPAKTFLAGPTSGGAAPPSFRSLAPSDIGTGTPDGTKFLRDDGTWSAVRETGGGWGRDSFTMVEEFFGPFSSGPAGGMTNWTTSCPGANAEAGFAPAGHGQAGVFLLRTANVVAQTCSIRIQDSIAGRQVIDSARLGGDWEFAWGVRLESTSNLKASWYVFHEVDPEANNIGIVFDSLLGPTFRARICVAGICTETDSSVPATAGVWYTMGLGKSGSTVTMKVKPYGGSEVNRPVSGLIPSVAGAYGPGVSLTTYEALSKSLLTDFVALTFAGLGR